MRRRRREIAPGVLRFPVPLDSPLPREPLSELPPAETAIYRRIVETAPPGHLLYRHSLWLEVIAYAVASYQQTGCKAWRRNARSGLAEARVPLAVRRELAP